MRRMKHSTRRTVYGRVAVAVISVVVGLVTIVATLLLTILVDAVTRQS